MAVRCRELSVVLVAMLITLTLAAQETTVPQVNPETQAKSAEQQSTSALAGKNQAPVIVPAGTRLALVLTNPVDSKSLHRGDEIHAQTTAPVTVGDRVAIPAGVFVQGPIEKALRKGNRGEFVMQSLSLMFADGSVAKINEPLTIDSDEWTTWRNPSDAAKAGAVIAPIAGLGLGALIGHAANTTQSSTFAGNTITTSSPKGLAIGSGVGLAAGALVSLVLLTRSHDFYVEAGSPMQTAFPQPLTLAASQTRSSTQPLVTSPLAIQPPVPLIGPPSPIPTDTGVCYTPGTPDTYIPGTPSSPEVYVPGTPPTPHPCPETIKKPRISAGL